MRRGRCCGGGLRLRSLEGWRLGGGGGERGAMVTTTEGFLSVVGGTEVVGCGFMVSVWIRIGGAGSMVSWDGGWMPCG